MGAASRAKGLVRSKLSSTALQYAMRALLHLEQDVATALVFHGVLHDVEYEALPIDLRRNFLKASEFDKTIRAFTNVGYEFVGISDFLKLLEHGSDARSPRRLALITFDDGYESVARVAFPILRSRRLPFVICPVSSFIEGVELLWTDRARLARHNAPDAFAAVIGSRDLKRIPDSERRRLLEQCEQRTIEKGVSMEVPPHYRPLEPNHLRELTGSGLAEVVFHTKTHPILAAIESLSEIEEECSPSGADWVTCQDIFCIPNGQRQDFDTSVEEVLRGLKYRHWFTTEPGYVAAGSDAEEIPRIVARQQSSRTIFEAAVALRQHVVSLGRQPPLQARWALDVGSRL